MAYARNRHGTSWAKHGTYLGRKGGQREDTIGHGFSSDRDDVDLTGMLRQWQQAGDPWFWKFIISPEHADRLDLREHTGALVAQMVQDLGTPLEWAAIDHHHGANAHVHLVVRGRDAARRPLEITPRYLMSGLRMRSRELATRVLGFRSEHEQLAARGRPIEIARFTEIDRTLLRLADDRAHVTYDVSHPPTRYGELTRLQELRRLQFLERLGLAQKTGERTWRLAPALPSALQHAEAADIRRRRYDRRQDISGRRVPAVETTLERQTAREAATESRWCAEDGRERQREYTR